MGGFATDARQRRERFKRIWHFPIELLQKDMHEGMNVLGFVVEKIDGFDVFAQFV